MKMLILTYSGAEPTRASALLEEAGVPGHRSSRTSVSAFGVCRTSIIGPQGLSAMSSKGVSAWPATAHPRPFAMRFDRSFAGTPRQRVTPT